MKNFTFQNCTKIIFGKGVEKEVGKEVKNYYDKILLHYGSGSIKRIGLYNRVIQSLEKENIEVIELPGVQPNPRLGLVRKGIDLCRREKIEFILAVGGGSVIDSAKAIAVGVLHSGDVWELFENGEIEEASSVGVILTIPAAGSESSGASVITREDGWYKRPIESDVLRPKFAILNPEVTFSLTPYQTAVGIADISAHLMERYFTQVFPVDLTDRLIEATLRSLIYYTPIVLREPRSYDARAEVMWAGTVAHNDFLSCGRIADWASHNIEHELSGIYDIPHGAGLAVIIPAWMRYVYKENMNKFIQFAYRVWGVESDFNFPERAALEGILRLKAFYKENGLPVSLKELNISEKRFDEMATKCTEKGPVGHFKKLYKKDVLKIYQLAG